MSAPEARHTHLGFRVIFVKVSRGRADQFPNSGFDPVRALQVLRGRVDENCARNRSRLFARRSIPLLGTAPGGENNRD